MEIKEAFRIDRAGSLLRKLGTTRFEVSRSSLLHGSLLLLILSIAFTVRLLPLRWVPTPWFPDHFYLSEFDPYFQYRITERIVERGFSSWAWFDYMSWYPYGRDIATTSFPGLPMTAAFFYMFLKALGVPIDLVYFSLLFPAFMGTVACLLIYVLGKDIGGESVGLFSAFFLALNSSYIERTSLGFFDDETVGVFGILLFILFFFRAIEKERPIKQGITYSVAAGLSLGYLSASWGAARYPIDMIVLFVFVLLLLRRYSPRLFLSYGICFGLTLLISAGVPRLGIGFLREITVLPVYGVFLLMCAFEIYHRMKTPKMKILGVTALIALVIIAISFLWTAGYLRGLEGKYISVLNPLEREAMPLVESVAEHKPSTWGMIYFDFGLLVFFVPIGLFFAVKMATDRSIFLSIFTLTSIYFASSMARLTLIMAPAVCLVCAVGVVRLTKPFATLLKESPVASRRKTFFRTHLGKEVGAGFMIVIFLLFTFTYVIDTDFSRGGSSQYPRVFDQAYSPTTIAAASIGIRPTSTITNWLNALIWMRENLPPSPPDGPTVVASWWDYGYWITVIANRTSLADNGTINSTQIKLIARMFMSPENESIQILKKFNATHVVVFITVDADGNDYPWGEAGKFIWMIRIPGLNESQYVTTDGSWTAYGKNTTLYKMMMYGKYKRLVEYGQLNAKVALQQYYELFPYWGDFNDRFNLVYYSKEPAVSGIYVVVLVYEIK